MTETAAVSWGFVTQAEQRVPASFGGRWQLIEKARREYEGYVHDRRRKAAALDLAESLTRDEPETGKAAPEWTHARVVALRDSIWALQRGYLNPMAIVRSTGGTTARQFTEDEEDAMKLAASCAALASEAFELSALRRSRPRPRALKRTADACLALYNRCADYCGVEHRGIDSPASTHAAAIKKQADARAREDAERQAAKGRWNSRKLTNMLRSIAYILGGHIKSGQLRAHQKRPVERARTRLVELRIADLAGVLEFGMQPEFWIIKDSTKAGPRWVLPTPFLMCPALRHAVIT